GQSGAAAHIAVTYTSPPRGAPARGQGARLHTPPPRSENRGFFFSLFSFPRQPPPPALAAPVSKVWPSVWQTCVTADMAAILAYLLLLHFAPRFERRNRFGFLGLQREIDGTFGDTSPLRGN